MHRALLVSLVFSTATAAADPPTIVRAARVIDGVSDTPRDNVAVLVDGERIAAIEPAAELAKKHPDARVIDVDDAKVAGGGFVAMGVDLPHSKSALPAVH